MSDDLTQSVPPFTPVPPTEPTPSVVEPSPPNLEPVRPATSATPTARKSNSARWINVLLVVAVAVAIGGVAFAIGRGTAPAAAAAFPGRGNFGNGNGPLASGAPGFGNGAGRGFGLGGGLTINGTVQSVTGDSMTITTASGQSVDITLSGDTAYHEQTAATASDVTVGSSVAVQVSGGLRPRDRRRDAGRRDAGRRQPFGDRLRRDRRPVAKG